MTDAFTGKVVNLVEVDLDFYRMTAFELVRQGQVVPGWESKWAMESSFHGDVDTSMPSGKVGRLASYTSSSVFYRYINAGASLSNMSTVAFFRALASPISAGVVIRGSGTATTRGGYRASCDGANLTFNRIVANVSTIVATVALPSSIAVNTPFWLQFDAETIVGGASLRAKVWTGEMDDAPSDYTLTYDDLASPAIGAGWTGIYTGSATADLEVGFFRVRSLFGSTVETRRYAEPASYLPADLYAIPNVKQVDFTPATVSLGENLGTRASVTVTFADHLGADLGELYNSGTYWGKFRGRALFLRGQPFRLIRGLTSQDLTDYSTYNLHLDQFNGPTLDDEFSMVAQDLLKFADNDRSQAPVLSNGFLLADLDAVTTTCSLRPVGVGNAEYPASGYINIGGKEIVSFTRSGDNLTIVRGQYGSVASTHNQEDRMQVCLEYLAQTPAVILNDLFTNYADIDPIYIPLAAWEAEVATYLARAYTRLIVEPTGVNKLASDLVQQAGLVIWWDMQQQLLQLQVLRGILTDTFEYNEDNTIKDSIKIEEQPDKRISEVWTYYGIRDPTQPLDNFNNFRSTTAAVDEESATLNGSAVVEKIYATWIAAFGRDAADRVNALQLGRYVNPPRKITFSIARDAGIPLPQLGGGYRLAYHGSQNEYGKRINIPMQITQFIPMKDIVTVQAEEMLFSIFDAADAINRVLTVDVDSYNIDLKTIHDANYPPVTAQDVAYGVNLTLIINSSVKVGSKDTTTPALVVAALSTTWPIGFPITIKCMGRVQGRGGDGNGFAGSFPDIAPAGGTALFTRFPCTLDFSTGTDKQVWGGGGAGHFGRGGTPPLPQVGGGGAGFDPGATAPTAAGTFPTTEAGQVVPPSGGSGGNPGQPGAASTGTSPNQGGAAGSAIDGVSHVTITGTGDIRGPEVN